MWKQKFKNKNCSCCYIFLLYFNFYFNFLFPSITILKQIQNFLNKRSFVHFADSESGGGVICCSFLVDVMSDLKKNNMKKSKCLESKRVQYFRNFNFCHVFMDSIILNNKSVVYFCGLWKWEGHLVVIFSGPHKWVTSKTMII